MITGFTCGAFDLLHPGHIAMLRECKEQCDWLIVGLHTDPTIDRPNKNKPIQTTFERWMQLDACVHVDYIIPYDTEEDLYNMMATLDIQKRFVGKDHEFDFITGGEVCAERGIEIIFNDRMHYYSSSELRNRINGSRK